MDYRRYISLAVRALVIRAYEEAYESSQASMSPEEGDDGFVFGVMVWRRAVARLGYYADQYGIHFTRRNNHIELRLANGTLRPYPGGRNPIDETAKLPFRADSQAKADLVTENTEQLTLFEGFPRVRLVLLHVGDAIHGLRELWIGAPYYDENEELIGWESPEQIYSSVDPIFQDVLDEEPQRKFPPFNQRPLPDVDMGPRQAIDEEDDRHRGSD
jgi:hypothetical protein